MADALDLLHRHPRLWKRVRRGQVPAWQARRVAQQTRRLPKPGARWVDDQLAHRIGCGPVITDRLVAQAAARFDPDEHQRRENQAAGSADVELTHPEPGEYAGASDLTAHGDTLTLQAFYDLACAIAHQLLLDGDTSLVRVNGRSRPSASSSPSSPAKAPSTSLTSPRRRQTVRQDQGLRPHRGRRPRPDGRRHRGEARRRHPGQDQVLGRPPPGRHPTRPQPATPRRRRLPRPTTVDARPRHPPRPHCVFPGCTRDARSCDLDHIQPYDPDGPPGQTNPDNLAALCRRHHRAKTLGLWRYTRTPDGDYLWNGPHGISMTVTV